MERTDRSWARRGRRRERTGENGEAIVAAVFPRNFSGSRAFFLQRMRARERETRIRGEKALREKPAERSIEKGVDMDENASVDHRTNVIYSPGRLSNPSFQSEYILVSLSTTTNAED